MKKGNKVNNWERQYKPLNITYSEEIDKVPDLSMVSLYRYVHQDILKYLHDHKNARIIECGCGGARVSLYLALRGYDVTCSDFTPEALRLAKANFKAFNANGEFLLDDLMSSKISSETYDCVMSFGLLEHFNDLDSLAINLTRLLKPGGIQIHFVIPSKFSTETMANMFWFPFRFLNLALRHRKFNNIIKRSYREFPHFENNYSWWEYLEAFNAVGNQTIRCEPQKVLLPILNHWPFHFGDFIAKRFSRQLLGLMKLADRTESRILHYLSPGFNIVCRKMVP